MIYFHQICNCFLSEIKSQNLVWPKYTFGFYRFCLASLTWSYSDAVLRVLCSYISGFKIHLLLASHFRINSVKVRWYSSKRHYSAVCCLFYILRAQSMVIIESLSRLSLMSTQRQIWSNIQCLNLPNRPQSRLQLNHPDIVTNKVHVLVHNGERNFWRIATSYTYTDSEDIIENISTQNY